MAVLKVATYNIHSCKGTDGRYDPHRIAEVLKTIDADIIGLQEVNVSAKAASEERRHHQPYVPETPPPVIANQLEFLAEQTGYHMASGLFDRFRGGLFGNALLTRHPIISANRIDLTVRGSWERRMALDAMIRFENRDIRVIIVHLGLEILERHFQVQRLIRSLGADRECPIVMMGDFNLVVSVLPKLRRFYSRLGHAPLARTFPSRFPLLSLDRIWVQPACTLKTVESHRTPLTRVASDHLPLVGLIELPNPL